MRKRLLISSLLGSVPLIVLGLILLFERYFTVRDFYLEQNLTEARLAAAYTEGWVAGQVRTLRTLARSNEIQRGSIEEIEALAERQLAAQPDWDSVWVTDATGQEIVETEGRLVYVGDRQYFRQAKRTGEPAVSNILVNRVTGELIIAIAYPIVTDGEFRGIVAAGIRPQEIQRVFSRVSARTDSTIALWGSDRRLIARSNTPESLIGQQFDSPNAEEILLSRRAGTGTIISPVSGKRSLIGYAPVNGAPWTVVSSIPVSVALSPAVRNTAIFILSAAVVLALSLAWSIYVANAVARQVSLLAESARAIGAGQLETRVNLNTGGELADLADSLNKMAADLQVIDRMKSDLLSMVSHELKTPLTSIRTSIDLIGSGMVPADDPRFQELINIADRQSRRLQDLIENLLSVARLEAGGLSVTRRPVSLASIVETSAQQYADIARSRGLSLSIEPMPDVTIAADAAKIVLVLNNLLDNAIKFTETGSITVRAEIRDGQAMVTVSDTGIGLTPEAKERLFEKFYQAEPLLTRRAGGAGLGLYVSKAIIDSHEGRIFAESDEAQAGSTFGFTLPLASRT